MTHQEDGVQTDASTQISQNTNETENGGSETNLNEAIGENSFNSNTFKPIVSAEPDDKTVRTSSGRISRPPK